MEKKMENEMETAIYRVMFPGSLSELTGSFSET